MKFSVKPEKIKNITLGAGGLGLALRVMLYATGTDEKGLLVAGHWAGIAMWILTALVAALLYMTTKSIQGPEDYRDAHPVSYPAGLGALGLALGILITTISDIAEPPTSVNLAVWILGALSVVALAAICLCRLSGSKPIFLLHGIVCIYFAMRMVSRYRLWSSDPQLADYAFYLGAYVALMLTAYHQAAFDADMGRHHSLWMLSLAAVYLCCLSLKETMDTVLLLTAGIWAFTNLTSLTPQQKRQRPKLNWEEE